MGLSLGIIAAKYGCELRGDPDFEVGRVATLQNADGESITFLANSNYRSQLATTHAGAVILAPEDADDCPAAALITKNPYNVYAHVADTLHPAAVLTAGIDPAATVGPGCTVPESCQIAAGARLSDQVTLGERVYVGPNSVVGANTEIADDTRLMAGVVIYDKVRIGRRCLFHAGAVIGADGFGIAKDESNAWTKVPQLGAVVIGDDVEVGAVTTIDRGAIDDTVIGDGVKLDNHIQVGHNVTIGSHTVIAALVGISGSTRIGSRCIIGGQSGFAGHLEVVDDVVLTAGTPVLSSIRKPGVYGGVWTHADEASRWRRNAARFRHLDEMARRLRKLEKRVDELTGDKE